MSNLNWEFFEAYKILDELCKEILSSDKGITEYIAQMDNDSQGCRLVSCWEKDYKKLKKMRWMRNQLAHETNSLPSDFVTSEDIEWLNSFRSRILEGADPFALLHQARNMKRKMSVKQTIRAEQAKGLVSGVSIRKSSDDRGSTDTILNGIAIAAVAVGIVILMAVIFGMAFIICFL